MASYNLRAAIIFEAWVTDWPLAKFTPCGSNFDLFYVLNSPFAGFTTQPVEPHLLKEIV